VRVKGVKGTGYPRVKDIAEVVRGLAGRMDLKEFVECEDCDEYHGMDLTVGWSLDGRWSWQTGDNSFTGSAYYHPHWAVVTLDPSMKTVRASRAVAREIIDQLQDLVSWMTQDEVKEALWR
jgi:hypothetical protein